MSATMHGGEHAGWIYKQGSLVKSWKKRFMVLRGKQLTYYDTERLTPRVKEKGSFQVITVELSSDIQNGLIVHGRGGRVLKLYTDAADKTNGWYNAIMDATTGGGVNANANNSHMERYSSFSGSAHSGELDDDQLDILSRLESLPLEEAQVQYSGWLTKEGMRVKSWKRRYFTLRGDTLSYFDSADVGSNAKGYGHVRAVEVNGERANSLDIRFDNGRILRVAAESPKSMQEWLCKLSDAVEAAHMDNNNARQSLAIRSSFRASMSAATSTMAKDRQSMHAQPLRHSIPGPVAQVSPPQRPSIANMNTRMPPRPQPHQQHQHQEQVFDRRRSSNGSYGEMSASYAAQSSTLSSNQSGEYFDEDSDSEGDWI